MTSTEELERLIKAGTPDRPWHYSPWHVEEGPPAVRHPSGYIIANTDTNANAALIVAAVNALPELLERVRRLEEALKPFADEADKWANCIDKDAQEILIANPIDVTVDSYGESDGLNDAAFTLGDLRRARAALNQEGGQ